MGFMKKLLVILYKNLLLRGSQWFVSSMEILLPIFFIWLVCKLLPSHDCVNIAESNGTIETGEGHSISGSWCGKRIYISLYPNNTETTEALTKLNESCGGEMVLFSTTSEESLLLSLKEQHHIGIVFPDGLKPLKDRTNGSPPVKNAVLSYTIRIHASKLPTTKRLFPEKLGDPDLTNVTINKRHRDNYTSSKFLSIQRSLDKVLIEMITGQQNPNFQVSFEMLDKYLSPQYNEAAPKQPNGYYYISDEPLELYKGASFAVIFIPILLSFSILFMIPTITRNVVSEKQTGIGELLKSAGVSGGIQWLGWMINSLVPMLFAVSICTLLLFTRLGGVTDMCVHEAVLVYSDWSLVWFILMLHVLSTIAMCFFICSVVKKPTIATIIALIISVVSTFLFLSPANKIMISIFPNCALSFAYFLIERADRTILDETEKPFGAQWNWELFNTNFELEDNTDRERHDISDVNMVEIVGMMIADVVLYSLLALYFESVLPSEFGVRRPWYFFNFPEYWRIIKNKVKRPRKVSPEAQMMAEEELDSVETAGEDGKVTTAKSKESTKTAGKDASSKSNTGGGDPSFEPEAVRDTPVGIELQNVYKSFGVKKAVNGVSLKMYAGDIFALLGHNGAGKTTLISVLTGFFSPTRGTAIVGGHDIRNNMESARKQLGLCPQHNMLFDNISVIKQLVIFGMLRGLNCKEANHEAENLLFKMNLIEKLHTSAKKLSGGQKRKVSLAMALIGGTKVVVLDEPTSGMDPQARREIWDLLLELREGRTILLTTHFMEEADVLGDRIGIMAAGRVQCCGTATFLKKYYGTGYTLKLTLQQSQKSQDALQQEGSSKTSVPVHPSARKILSQVQNTIPDASIKKDARSDAKNSEVFLTLPGETATTGALTQMFSDLNGNKSGLGIQTIGLQQTTMDEVFLRVGEIAEEEQGAAQKYEWTDEDFQKAPKLNARDRCFSQFIALLRKKWLLLKSRWVQVFFEVFFPFCLILGFIALLQSKPETEGSNEHSRRSLGQNPESEPEPQPKLLISLDDYSNPITYYYSDATTPDFEDYIKQVIGSSSKMYTGEPQEFKKNLAWVGKSDMRQYKRKLILAVKKEGNSITTMFNSFPYHSTPLALNTAANLVLKAWDPSANIKIQVTNHPWTNSSKPSKSSRSGYDYNNNGDPNSQGRPQSGGCSVRLNHSLETKTLGSCVLLLLAFILLTAPFILGPLEEKITNVKQLQLMTGLQPASYWLAHFVCDFSLYFIFVLLTIILVVVIEAAGHEVLSIDFGAGVLFLIMMCFGFSSILLVYLLSLRSKTLAGGFSLVVLIHLITGIVFGYPLVAARDFTQYLELPFNILHGTVLFICYCFPSTPTLMALGIYSRIAMIKTQIAQCTKGQGSLKISYLQWSVKGKIVNTPGVIQELFFVLLVGFVYLLLLMLIEYKICRRICGKETPPPFPPNIYDDDVYKEAERVNILVQSGEVFTECMVIQNLSKAFGGFAAVSQVNFGVHYGECFGLLGVNGAGKTTVFKMITGEEFPSEGNIFGFGTTTIQNPKIFFSNIGYCPQFDAIFVKFTGREMLELFGVLRGLPYKGAKMEATKWLQRFGLIESANVQCGKYSGGMKRRLSTAMAMIGDPGLLLLDEPTSGVDPVSRHQFWAILEKIRDSGQSIILTSHSMDECEALCSRLGIMVNGQFQCFGGVQHLKTKFAQGYSLTIKLKPDLAFGTPEIDEKLTKFQEEINKKFQPCVLKDRHQNLLQYHLQNPSTTWDGLFKQLEGVKKDFGELIEDYSVNETSLEEVFLSFARMQYDERRVDITTCAQVCTCGC